MKAELPDPETLAILRDAMAPLKPADLAKLTAAIKAASKTNLVNIRDVERVLREMGDSTLVSSLCSIKKKAHETTASQTS